MIPVRAPSLSRRDLVFTLGTVAALLAACGGPSASPSPSGAPPATLAPTQAAQPSVASGTATPLVSTTPLPAACTLVADELLNPRGISVSPDGTLYIAEAGDGGQEPDFPNAPPASPGASAASPAASAAGSPLPVATHGETGRVSKVTPDGTQSVVVDGLTSYNFGDEVVGPADVVVGSDGILYASIGGPGPGLAQIVSSGTANKVISIDSSGTVTILADLGEAERSQNPDPYFIDSDIGGLALGTDGLLYVADSGGNDIWTVDPQNGNLNLLAVIPGLPAPDGAPNPGRGGNAEVDPVPTDVEADPNGGVFVGLLTGAALWGTPGSAKVLHVDTDGTIADAATALDTVVGVAVRADQSLYASQLSTSMLAQPPAPGSVVLAEDAAPQPAITDLPLPYGIAFGPDGNLYIAINASAPAGTPPQGQVLKCELQGVPVPSPTPAATTEPASPSAQATSEPASPSAQPTTEPTTEPTQTASPVATEEPSATPTSSTEASSSPAALSIP